MTERTFPPGTVIPTQFLRFTDFLPTDLHEEVLEFAASITSPLEQGQVEVAPATPGTDQSVRRAQVLGAVEDAWPPINERILTLLPLLLPAGSDVGCSLDEICIERSLLRYGDGDFYTTHYDSGGHYGAGRLVTFVYYFGFQPKAFDGGELWLHDTLIDDDGFAIPAESYACIEPEDNSIVFFASHAFHQVRPVQARSEDLAAARFAINGWLREPYQQDSDALTGSTQQRAESH